MLYVGYCYYNLIHNIAGHHVGDFEHIFHHTRTHQTHRKLRNFAEKCHFQMESTLNSLSAISLRGAEFGQGVV